MKQIRTLLTSLFLLMALLTGAKAYAQKALTVCDGTATSNNVPINPRNACYYLKCEYIIPAEELSAMSGQSIYDITWYINFFDDRGIVWDGTFQIFMREVAESTISAYYGIEGSTLVYEGFIDNFLSKELTIEFDTPYNYGGGHLLIGVYQTEKSFYPTPESFYGVERQNSCVQGSRKIRVVSIPSHKLLLETEGETLTNSPFVFEMLSKSINMIIPIQQ